MTDARARADAAPPPHGHARPGSRALVVALLRREWASPWHLPAAAAVAVGAVLLGHRLGEAAAAARVSAVGAIPAGAAAVAGLGRSAGVAVALAGVLLVAERVASDRDARWLAPLLAAGASRAAYALAVTVAAAVVVAAGAALTLPLVAVGAAPRDAALAGALVAAMPGVAALALSCTVYGALCALLARSRGAALALAAAGLVLPAAAALLHEAWLGQPLPRPVLRAITLHLPPITASSDGSALLRHLAWAALAGAALAWLAPRTVGREP